MEVPQTLISRPTAKSSPHNPHRSSRRVGVENLTRDACRAPVGRPGCWSPYSCFRSVNASTLSSFGGDLQRRTQSASASRARTSTATVSARDPRWRHCSSFIALEDDDVDGASWTGPDVLQTSDSSVHSRTNPVSESGSLSSSFMCFGVAVGDTKPLSEPGFQHYVIPATQGFTPKRRV